MWGGEPIGVEKWVEGHMVQDVGDGRHMSESSGDALANPNTVNATTSSHVGRQVQFQGSKMRCYRVSVVPGKAENSTGRSMAAHASLADNVIQTQL